MTYPEGRLATWGEPSPSRAPRTPSRGIAGAAVSAAGGGCYDSACAVHVASEGARASVGEAIRGVRYVPRSIDPQHEYARVGTDSPFAFPGVTHGYRLPCFRAGSTRARARIYFPDHPGTSPVLRSKYPHRYLFRKRPLYALSLCLVRTLEGHLERNGLVHDAPCRFLVFGAGISFVPLGEPQLHQVAQTEKGGRWW